VLACETKAVARGSWLIHRRALHFLPLTKEPLVVSDVIQELEARIRSLDPAEKTELLRSLIAEIDAPIATELDDAWIAEAKKRYRQIADGTAQNVPADEVFEEVRSQLKR
jgi:putative addiction module component (TIGR02574 family)